MASREKGKSRVISTVLILYLGLQMLTGCSSSSVQASLKEETPSKSVVAMTAEPETFVDALDYKGYVTAREEKNISFGLSGKVQTVYVEKGQQIQAGDIIAQLDTKSILTDIDKANQNIRSAQNSVNQVYDSADKIRSNIEAGYLTLETLELALKGEEINLEKLKNSYETKISNAQINYSRAEVDYNRTKTLYDAGAVTQVALENSEIALSTAVRELEDVQRDHENDLMLQENGIQNVQNQIRQQEIAIESLEKDLRAVSTKVEAGNIQVRQSQIGVEQYQQQLEETVLTAPVDGYVTDVLIKAGENTSYGAVVAKIQSEEKVISIGVPLADYRLIQPGMAVVMEANDTQFSGAIVSIALSPDESSRTYAVEIEPDHHDLAVGTLVEVYIPVETTQIVFIPLDTIVTTGGVNYVYILKENGDGETYKVAWQEIFVSENPVSGRVAVDNIETGTLIVSEGVKDIKENDIVTVIQQGVDYEQ